MKALHLINKRNEAGGRLRNLELLDPKKSIFASGYWDIPLPEAETLIGGTLYLHEKKSKAPDFIGRVISVEEVEREEFARSKRVIFKVQSLPKDPKVKWRGADHAMAHSGGIIEVAGDTQDV